MCNWVISNFSLCENFDIPSDSYLKTAGEDKFWIKNPLKT